MRRPPAGRAGLWAPVILAAAAMPLAAQERDTTRAAPPPAPVVAPGEAAQDTGMPITPGGAWIRSMILPGWGQATFHAYFRGSVYFAGWAGNWYMNFRNAYRLDNVRTRLDLRTRQIRRDLIRGAPSPDSMRARLDSFPDILSDSVRADSLGNALFLLEDSRRQQREDWIAWSVFWILASGIDAYVTAHLSDFPAEVGLRPNRDGSMTLQVGLPWPGRGPPGPPGSAPVGVPPP